jgi:hypothetical protein
VWTREPRRLPRLGRPASLLTKQGSGVTPASCCWLRLGLASLLYCHRPSQVLPDVDLSVICSIQRGRRAWIWGRNSLCVHFAKWLDT